MSRSRIALFQLDDAVIGGILLFDELLHLGQQFHLVPGIARGEHQIEKHIGVGLARHDAQIMQRKRRVQLAQLSVRRLRSTPTAASEVTMGS